MTLVKFEKRPRLTKAQDKLLQRIYIHMQYEKPIEFKDAIEIWTNYVCRELVDGKPHYYSPYKNRDSDGHWIGGLISLNEQEIKMRAVQWLMFSLGALVLKGYLKVLPVINLEK